VPLYTFAWLGMIWMLSTIAERQFLWRGLVDLSHIAKGKRRGSSYRLTTVRGVHHDLTVVCAGTGFLLILCSMGMA